MGLYIEPKSKDGTKLSWLFEHAKAPTSKPIPHDLVPDAFIQVAYFRTAFECCAVMFEAAEIKRFEKQHNTKWFLIRRIDLLKAGLLSAKTIDSITTARQRRLRRASQRIGKTPEPNL